MAHILILGGGAAGLAAALAAAQAAPSARVTVLERNPKVGKKLLATGNGRCNLCWRCWSCICSGTPYSCAPAAR